MGSEDQVKSSPHAISPALICQKGVTVCPGLCPVLGRLFSSTSDLHPQTVPVLLPYHSNQKCLQAVPNVTWGAKSMGPSFKCLIGSGEEVEGSRREASDWNCLRAEGTGS